MVEMVTGETGVEEMLVVLFLLYKAQGCLSV
jgi:hypothetical protein